ncbi:MAG TPA: PhzF family phenazine biosynthesis protein [Burkholderiaceae bacterium]|jgi:trans-2,3-dihydro-3-hydroxyanthranilate isomerase|nr:PhzF family phenazine biosynthesis protein [Burkholderiaceae bacterium]
MKDFHFTTCDVFTDRMFSGNPLAVLTDARGLDDQAMQSIAREFNFSETTFVTAPADSRNTARVRIFTPTRELPFAGHPTVGTAFVLASADWDKAAELVLEENIGPVPVRIERDNGRIVRCTFTSARLPECIESAPPTRRTVADMLQIAVDEVAGSPEVWSCGVPYLVTPIATSHALMRAQLDLMRWRDALAGFITQEVYPIAQLDASTWRVRMFAPGAGVAEDPATGSAAAALAGWLVRRDPRPSGTRRWTVLQGEAVGRPSQIELEADVHDGIAQAVRVGGASVLVSEGVLRL